MSFRAANISSEDKIQITEKYMYAGKYRIIFYLLNSENVLGDFEQ